MAASKCKIAFENYHVLCETELPPPRMFDLPCPSLPPTPTVSVSPATSLGQQPTLRPTSPLPPLPETPSQKWKSEMEKFGDESR